VRYAFEAKAPHRDISIMLDCHPGRAMGLRGGRPFDPSNALSAQREGFLTVGARHLRPARICEPALQVTPFAENAITTELCSSDLAILERYTERRATARVGVVKSRGLAHAQRDIVSLTKFSLRTLARRAIELEQEITEIDATLKSLVKEIAPELVSTLAIGTDAASALLGAALPSYGLRWVTSFK
jgi:hypothetical protein